MNVLFVASGNGKLGISPIIKNQAESLKSSFPELKLDFFLVEGKGIINYIKAAKKLRNHFKQNKYDLVHSHYAFSGYVTVMSMTKLPTVVSIMGGDAYMGFPYSHINKFSARYLWNSTIIKSSHLKTFLKLKNNYSVIPNGVDLQKFTNMNVTQVREKLGLAKNKTYILFASDPKRNEKNFELAQKSYNSLKLQDSELLIVFGKSNKLMPIFYNAADVLLFSSHREGSPNVIKEAMACNLPIVSSNVGDVEWLIDGVNGCYLTSFDLGDVADKIKLALEYSAKVGRTKGRERLIKLGLDSETVAKKIIGVYKEVLGKTK